MHYSFGFLISFSVVGQNASGRYVTCTRLAAITILDMGLLTKLFKSNMVKPPACILHAKLNCAIIASIASCSLLNRTHIAWPRFPAHIPSQSKSVPYP